MDINRSSIICNFCLIGLWFLISTGIIVGQSGAPKRPDDPPPTLCDLQSNPLDSKDRELEINAIYNIGFEMVWLDGIYKCLKHDGKIHTFKYRFGEHYRENTSRKLLKQWDKLLKQKPKFVTTPQKVTGKFLIRLQDYKYERPGFVDKRYEFEIVILKILSVSKKN